MRSAGYTEPAARRSRKDCGARSTTSIWSAARTTASGTVSRWVTPVIFSTTALRESMCCTFTVVMTSMPASSSFSTSFQRLS